MRLERPFRAAASLVLGLAVLLTAGGAWAQSSVPVAQQGLITRGHIAKFIRNGQVIDAGGINGDVNGAGVGPFAISDSSALGLCSMSPSYTFCLGHDTTGNALLTIDALSAAAPKTFYVRKNGTLYEWPGSGAGTMVGPVSTITNHLVAWDNDSGTLAKDAAVSYIDANGLNIRVGTAPSTNSVGYALQVHKTGSDLGDFASAAIFGHNIYTGADALANVNGIYGDLWYSGGDGNMGVGVKGNVYTYTSTSSLLGTFPNQYFSTPTIGTVPYIAGVYGRAAHYLPGNITYAAAIMADGLYNLSTPAAGTIDINTNILVVPPYADGATTNYAVYIRDATCSPTCYTSTIHIANDPLTLSTGSAAVRNINLKPGNASAFVDVFAPLRAGVNFGCQTQIGGHATTPALTSLGTNCALEVNAQGTGSVFVSNNNLTTVEFAATTSAVNHFYVKGSAAGGPVVLASAGNDASIGVMVQPKGGGVFAIDGGNLQITTFATPGTAGDACDAGTIAINTGFIHVCTASGAWKRVAIATW